MNLIKIKKWRWPAVLILLVCAIFGFWRYHHLLRFDLILNEARPSPEAALGIYTKDNGLKPAEDIDHIEVRLNDRNWSVSENDFYSEAKILIVSLLPYDALFTHRYNDALKSVVEGKYDQRFSKLFQLLNLLPNRVYLRFAPEMELPGLSYPWQRYGYLFTSAFERIAAIADSTAPNLQMMWGPAAYPGVLEFTPDLDRFDAVSITLNSPRELALNAYPNHPADYQLERKIHRMRFVDKPIVVLSADSRVQKDFDQHWLKGYEDQRLQIPALEWNEFSEDSSADTSLQFGLYDPELALTSLPDVDAEHIFCDFEMIQNGSLEILTQELAKRGHDLILTIEPNLDKQNRQILEEILAGKHDPTLMKLAGILSGFDHQIYLRFAHEMEIPIERYPWQSKDPLLYIRCYRHFMAVIQHHGPNFTKVWGPAGDRGSVEWYPGDDVVDLISFAVYGLPDKNITDPEKQEKFSTIFNRKLWRFRMIDKPIFITEFGVKGPQEFQEKWLLEAAHTLNNQKRIVGVCYFNFRDVPQAWGDIKPPKWSVSRKSMQAFLNSLN